MNYLPVLATALGFIAAMQLVMILRQRKYIRALVREGTADADKFKERESQFFEAVVTSTLKAWEEAYNTLVVNGYEQAATVIRCQWSAAHQMFRGQPLPPVGVETPANNNA